MSKQFKIIEDFPTKHQIDNLLSDKLIQHEKAILLTNNEIVQIKVKELLSQPKSDIDSLKHNIKHLLKQTEEQRNEINSEVHKLRSTQINQNSVLLLKSDKSDVDSTFKRIDNKIAVFKQELNKQIEHLSNQLIITNENTSNIKILAHDETTKLSKLMTKKQDSLCEKIIELENKMAHVKLETNSQSNELLNMIKNSQGSIQSLIQGEVESIKNEIENTKNFILSQVNLKPNSSDLAKQKKFFKEAIEMKANTNEINFLIEKINTENIQKHVQIQSECEKSIDVLRKDMVFHLKKKATLKDFEALISDKVSSTDFQTNIEPIFKKITDLDEKVNFCEKKIKLKNSKVISIFNEQISKIEQNCDRKATFSEVQKLVEKKASVDDFNNVLASLQNQLHLKANSEDIQKLIDEQEQFNEFFSTESIIARYKWKSGQFSNTPFVPFEVECLNTLKENFIWEKNATSLVVMNGGLYEIAFGFFSKIKPSAKLFFNNEAVCVCNGPSNIDIGKSMASTGKINGKDDKKNLTLQKFPSNGLTSFDYYLVPDNCKISLYCIGEMIIEGFINIRRL